MRDFPLLVVVKVKKGKNVLIDVTCHHGPLRVVKPKKKKRQALAG
jgi:hypothetical protein